MDCSVSRQFLFPPPPGAMTLSIVLQGFPGGASGLKKKNPPANAGDVKRHGFDPWVRKIPWRRAWKPTQVFLPGESRGQRSLAGYSPEGCKESDMTEAIKHTHISSSEQEPLLFITVITIANAVTSQLYQTPKRPTEIQRCLGLSL